MFQAREGQMSSGLSVNEEKPREPIDSFGDILSLQIKKYFQTHPFIPF